MAEDEGEVSAMVKVAVVLLVVLVAVAGVGLVAVVHWFVRVIEEDLEVLR